MAGRCKRSIPFGHVSLCLSFFFFFFFLLVPYIPGSWTGAAMLYLKRQLANPTTKNLSLFKRDNVSNKKDEKKKKKNKNNSHR